MRTAVAVVAVIAATSAVSARLPASRGQVEMAAALFDAYDGGDHAQVRRAFAAANDVAALRGAIERTGERWTAAAGPAAAPRRRLVAAAVALEFAAVRMEDEWKALRSLVEWGCRLIRKDAVSDAERTFHLASVALGQGARDRGLLFDDGGALPRWDHLKHARSRFPDEPRFQLAQVWLTAGEPVLGERYMSDFELAGTDHVGFLRVGGRRRIDGEIRRLEKLAAVPSIRHEALVLAGFLHVARNRLGPAQAAFREAAHADAEPFVRYLAQFLLGRTFARQERVDDAAAAYARALEVIPHAQSAALARAALLFQAGNVDTALALVNHSFAARPRPQDPWRLFGYGDFRRLPQYLERLRAELGR
jgi:tetratricopeptide (TPR) repeat protein